MLNNSAKIAGLGYYVPKKVLTNADLEKMVDTSDEWITSRTGIKERRMADDNETTADLAVKAAINALENADMAVEELELIIVATATPNHLMPSTATIVQRIINATNAVAFDISAACSGFIFAMNIAHQFVATGTYKNALVIGAETMTKFIDFTDRNTCVLFGDGAGAALLTRCDSGDGILGSYIKSDGKNFITIPAGGSAQPASQKTVDERSHYIQMTGRDVYKFGVRIVPGAVTSVLEKCDLTIDDVYKFIFHQANVRIVDAVCSKLNIDPEKSYVNLQRYGNTSAASIPIALNEAINEKAIKKGDIVVLIGFGAGMTWGATAIKI